MFSIGACQLASTQAQEVGKPTPVPIQPNAQAKPPVKKNQRYWNTQWAFEDIDAEKLTSRLESIGIDLGVDLSGTASIDFEVGVPLTALGDGAAYRLSGMLTSPNLKIDGVEFQNFSSLIDYRDGLAVLQNLKTELLSNFQSQAGTVSGSGSMQLVPRGDFDLKVDVNRVAIAPIAKLVGRFVDQETLVTAGIITGKVTLSAPVNTISQIETYQLEATSTGRDLVLRGLPPADFVAQTIKIDEGVLAINGFELIARDDQKRSQAIRLSANASMPLVGNGEFKVDVSGDDVPTEVVLALLSGSDQSSLLSLVQGKLDMIASGSGTIAESMAKSEWELKAKLASPKLMVAGVDVGTIEHDVVLSRDRFSMIPIADSDDVPKSFLLKKIEAAYSVTDQNLTVSELIADVFGGSIRGKGTLPLREQGEISIDVRLQNVQPTIQITMPNGFASSLTSSVSGDMTWRVPGQKLNFPASHQGRANVVIKQIELGNQQVGEFTVQSSAGDGQISLAGDGRIFGGTLNMKTVARTQVEDQWRDIGIRLQETSIAFDDVSIEAMLARFTNRRPVVTGRASGIFGTKDLGVLFADDLKLPESKIDVRTSQVRHQDRMVSRRLVMAGSINGGIFQAEKIVGDYAGGTLRVGGRVYLQDAEGGFHPRADLTLRIGRVDLEPALWFLGSLASDYQGKGSGTAQVTGFGESLRVRGNVDGSDLVLYGVPLGHAHSSIAVDTSLMTNRWQLRFPSVRSSVGGGQVEGELALSSTRRGGRGVDLESRWKTRRADFLSVTNQLGQGSALAKGEVTGNLTLGGKSIRSVDDLKGRYDFRLGETRGAAIPGLANVSRFLGPVSLATERFTAGEAKGIIARGAVVVDEFWLSSDNALVQADGKIFIRSQRMDLNAIVATGDFRDLAESFARLSQQYALRSLLPASALLSITELLLDRTVVLRILGTTSGPIVRLRPVETFREEAARILLREGQRLIIGGVTAGAIDNL